MTAITAEENRRLAHIEAEKVIAFIDGIMPADQKAKLEPVAQAAARAEADKIADEYERTGFITDEMNDTLSIFSRIRDAAFAAMRSA